MGYFYIMVFYFSGEHVLQVKKKLGKKMIDFICEYYRLTKNANLSYSNTLIAYTDFWWLVTT